MGNDAQGGHIAHALEGISDLRHTVALQIEHDHPNALLCCTNHAGQVGDASIDHQHALASRRAWLRCCSKRRLRFLRFGKLDLRQCCQRCKRAKLIGRSLQGCVGIYSRSPIKHEALLHRHGAHGGAWKVAGLFHGGLVGQ